MKNNQIIKLDNGLTLILCQDTTKHNFNADLLTRIGGNPIEVLVDGKKYKLENGTAHFLEHLLIDHSKFGNAFEFFKNNYVSMNGVTTINMTNFYISTVHDYEENLVRLIEIVNIANFNQENIDESKKVVIEEIHNSYDQKFRKLSRLNNECLFHKIDLKSNLGSEEYISSLDYETLKFWHDTLYQPKNQYLAISGNFDMQKIISLVEETYKRINKKEIPYEIIDYNEPKEVSKKEGSIKANTNDEYTQISFKIDSSDFTPFEKVKLTFYVNYFLAYNFGGVSAAYEYAVKNNLTKFSIDSGFDMLIDKFVILSVGMYTDKKDEFITLVLDTIKNKKFDKEDFDIRRKRSIISLILREENPSKILGPFVDNILSFDYYEMDKIEDIENMTFEDYQELINRLDFSNYTITTMLKEDINE